jgi:hypothetical protein
MGLITLDEILKIYATTGMVAIINDGQLVRVMYEEEIL